MNILPELNLNRHPKDCKDFSLVDAKHMTIDKDSYLLHTENSIKNYPGLDDKIKSVINTDYTIIYAIPCNREIVFFVLYKSNVIKLIRYNEVYDAIKVYGNIDYDGGIFTSTFTYNKNNLIISFSEFKYDDTINKPLKVIDLGKFTDTKTNINDTYHPICSEVIIPECITNYINGNARKGWYYIFVRYKLSNDTYTQWFNTGKTIFIDSYHTSNYEDYYISKQVFGKSGETITEKVSVTISDDTDIANVSFKTTFINLDNNYNNYQIGYINIRKDTTKCYVTDDINIYDNTYVFNSKFLHEDSVINLITSYNNYYNVKTIDSYNNVLYIGNYKEYDKTKNINVSNIDINLRGYNTLNKETAAQSRGTSGRPGLNTLIDCILPANTIGNNTEKIKKVNYKTDGDKTYIDALNMPIWPVLTNHWAYDTYYLIDINDADFANFSQMHQYSILEISINTIHYKCYASAVKYYFDINLPFNSENNYYEIQTVDGEVIKINTNNDNTTKDNICIISIDGNSIIEWVFNPGSIPPNDKKHFYCIPEKCIFSDKNSNTDIDYVTQNILDSNCICPNEYYNLFVHFVNKYGETTEGISINAFNIINVNNALDIYTNSRNNKLIYTKDDTIRIEANINKLPSNYIGYFISYEKFESHIKHKGFIYKNRFYSNDINVKLNETLDFNFNVVKTETSPKINIIDKTLYVADTYNNISNPTNILLEVNNNDEQYINSDDSVYAELINDNIDSLYSNKNKTLIQCTKVCYNTNEFINLYINNAFKTKIEAFKFNNTPSTMNDFGSNPITSDMIYFNNTSKIFDAFKTDTSYHVFNVFHNIVKDDIYLPVPTESYQYLNKPQVIFFPINGLDNNDIYTKGFAIGCITEMKNTVDLFQQKNFTVYDAAPKILINYVEDETYTNDFPKTIRRSNVIADESDHIGWRFFEPDNYRNIIENKGNIIKLSSIGNIMLIHTEHSLFQFKADQALKSQNGDNVVVGVNDIWELQYREIFTSELGFAGINHINHAIIGQYGYIFYEQDKSRFYRYDNNSIKQIDNTINNYIRKLTNTYNNVYIVDDVDRNRLLINFYNNDDKETLSYNYKYDTFVSRHDYKYSFGYTTKNNVYLLDIKKNTIKTFDKYKYNDYLLDDNKSYVCIILNTDYELNKVIEYIKYKLNKLLNTDDVLPVNKRDSYYSGELLRLISEECDTDDMNIYIENPRNTINSVKDYTKPYRELGNWNFNYIRDNSRSISGDTTQPPVKESDDKPRFYGNYFIVKFTFSPNTIANDCVELETINYAYSKNLT